MNGDPEALRLQRDSAVSLPSSLVNKQIGDSPPSLPTTPSPPISSLSMNQGQLESLSAMHTLIISLITTVGGYVLFQYQSKRLSLFDEHGNIMRAVFLILFLYVMALIAELKLKNQINCLSFIKLITPLVGLLVVVLLLFILSLGLGLAASIIWALLAVEPIINLFKGIIRWFCGLIIHVDGMILHFRSQTQTPTSNFYMEERDSHGIELG